MVIVLVLFLVALLLAMAAVLAVLRARRKDHEVKVEERLRAFAFIPDPNATRIRASDNPLAPLEAWLARVGLRIEPQVALLLAGVGVLSTIVIWQTLFPLAGLIWAILVITFAVLIPQVRYRQRINAMVAQIPLFIDQVVRGERVVQPRLMHRYQVDRHGLAVSVHQLNGDATNVEFDLHSMGRPLSQVLGAVYALERLESERAAEARRASS